MKIPISSPKCDTESSSSDEETDSEQTLSDETSEKELENVIDYDVEQNDKDNFETRYSGSRQRHLFKKGEYPSVVRGNILVFNTLEKNTYLRFVDVPAEKECNTIAVSNDNEEDASDDETAVENINVFHRKYLQYRQNPLYASDPDLSRSGEDTGKRNSSEKGLPAFTSIFYKQNGSSELNYKQTGPCQRNSIDGGLINAGEYRFKACIAQVSVNNFSNKFKQQLMH